MAAGLVRGGSAGIWRPPAGLAPRAAMPGLGGWVTRNGSSLVTPVSRAVITTGEWNSQWVRDVRGVVVDPFAIDRLAPVGRPVLDTVPVGSPPILVVRRGDNLWGIATRRYGSGAFAGDIARANHLANPDLVHPGQRLVLASVGRGQALLRS